MIKIRETLVERFNKICSAFLEKKSYYHFGEKKSFDINLTFYYLFLIWM